MGQFRLILIRASMLGYSRRFNAWFLLEDSQLGSVRRSWFLLGCD